MSKISLTLPSGEVCCTGKQVSFQAPCNSEEVTALIIEGNEYAICDLTGKEVCGTSDVWASGTIVSVILDCANKKAYIQGGSSGGSSSSGIPRKSTITLSASGWDANNSQVVYVKTVSIDESSQLVHVLPENMEVYFASNIVCSVDSSDNLKFVAETTPTTDLVVNIVIEDLAVASDVEFVYGYTKDEQLSSATKLMLGLEETDVPTRAFEVLASSMARKFVVNVPTDWTQEGDYYIQNIPVTGMLSSYEPIVSYEPASDPATTESYQKAFGNVVSVETLDGSIKVSCSKAPDTEFNIRMYVIQYSDSNAMILDAEGVGF